MLALELAEETPEYSGNLWPGEIEYECKVMIYDNYYKKTIDELE